MASPFTPSSSHASGLPSQWTLGADGSLTIAATDPTKTPLTIQMPVGAAANGGDAIKVKGELGDNLARVGVFGELTLLADKVAPADNGGGSLNLVDRNGAYRHQIVADASDVTADAFALMFESPAAGDTALQTFTGLRTRVIDSGALPTAVFVSATARQLSTSRDVACVVPFTGDATNNAATLKIELSPDDTTYSILDTLSIAAALNLSGAINVPVSFAVPAGWYVKLTAVHGTIGTATYY